MTQRSETSAPRQALIITRDPWERQAVTALVKDIHEEEGPLGLLFECGTFAGASSWKIAVLELGLSHLDAVAQTEIAVRVFAPDLALLIGAAFGLGVSWGDVVVSTSVLGFASDQPDKQFAPLPTLEIASPRLSHRARFEASRRDWMRRSATTSTPSRAIVAELGLSAIGFASGTPWLSYLQAEYPNVAVVDVGIYDVLRYLQTSSVDALVVRGILPQKAPSPEATASFRAEAARFAAAFAFQILFKLGAATVPLPRSSRPLTAPTKQYVGTLTVENIRSIRSLSWQLDLPAAPGWHVILGENGSGKSTFLRALSLSLLGRTEIDALRQDWATWLHQDATDGRAVARLHRTEGSKTATPPDPPSSVERAFRLERASEGVEASDGHVSDGVTCAPEPSSSDVFSVAYGPFRRFTGGDIDFEKELAAYPRLTRHLSLFSERAALTEALAWLKDLRFKQLEERPDGDLLGAVRAFLNHTSLLPHGARLAEVSSEAVRFTDGNGVTVPIEELSDGFRSILSLTLDLLRHFTTAFDASEVFSLEDEPRVIAPGIVLIDEVDAHLHPSWQHAIGAFAARISPTSSSSSPPTAPSSARAQTRCSCSLRRRAATKRAL